MPLDFPGSPSDEQKYDQYKFRNSSTSWQADRDKTGFQARIAAKEDIVPAGTIHLFAGSTAPTGFLLCQGQTVSRNTYPTLFTAISTNYGAGDGSTTFGIPDLQGRVAGGKNTSGAFLALNNRGGTEVETITTSTMPSHTHIQDSHNHTQDAHNHTLYMWLFNGYASGVTKYGAGSGVNTGAANTQGSGELSGNYNNATTASNNATTASNQDAGGLAGVTQSHNNLQPYIVLNYIIKT